VPRPAGGINSVSFRRDVTPLSLSLSLSRDSIFFPLFSSLLLFILSAFFVSPRAFLQWSSQPTLQTDTRARSFARATGRLERDYQ